MRWAIPAAWRPAEDQGRWRGTHLGLLVRASRSPLPSRARLRAAPAVGSRAHSQSLPASRTTLLSASPATRAVRVRCRALGTARWMGSISASSSTDGKVWVNPPPWIVNRLSVRRDQPAGMRPGRFGRNLLAQNRPHGEFGLVDRARNALSGCLGHCRRQIGVAGQRVHHRFGVGIEIQEPSAPGDRGGKVAEVVEHQLGNGRDRLRASSRLGRCRRAAAGCVDTHRRGLPRNPVRRRRPDDRKRPRRRTASGPAAEGTPFPARRCGFRTRTGPPRACVRTSACFEHQAHGVVELPDAGKPGGERDVAERQVGGLDQHPGGLRPLCAGQSASGPAPTSACNSRSS